MTPPSEERNEPVVDKRRQSKFIKFVNENNVRRDGLVVSILASCARGPGYDSRSSHADTNFIGRNSPMIHVLGSGWSGLTLPSRSSCGHAAYSQLPGASV